MKLPSWDMLGHIRDVTPQQLETTLKVRFLRGSAKSCTVYDHFQAVHYCPVPLCNGSDVGPLLYLCPLYTCLLHETFFEARSRWYSSLLRDSNEICRFFAGTYSQNTWHSVSMSAGVSSSPPPRDFSVDLSHTIGTNQSKWKNVATQQISTSQSQPGTSSAMS